MGKSMRNYELIKEIYYELIKGENMGSFRNQYLNRVISATKLIEKERPELMKEFGEKRKK